MRYQRAVPMPPRVSDSLGLFDNQHRKSKRLQAGGQVETRLPCAYYQDSRLLVQKLLLALSPLVPVAFDSAAFEGIVATMRSVVPSDFLRRVQFLEGRVDHVRHPGTVRQTYQPDHAFARADVGLKREHGFDPVQSISKMPFGNGRQRDSPLKILNRSLLLRSKLASLVRLEVAEPDFGESRIKQIDDILDASLGVEFPIDCQLIAPPAIFVNQTREVARFAACESGLEC